jgi:hypothetical protein
MYVLPLLSVVVKLPPASGPMTVWAAAIGMSERLIDANAASILVIHAARKRRSVANRLVIIKSPP